MTKLLNLSPIIALSLGLVAGCHIATIDGGDPDQQGDRQIASVPGGLHAKQWASRVLAGGPVKLDWSTQADGKVASELVTLPGSALRFIFLTNHLQGQPQQVNIDGLGPTLTVVDEQGPVQIPQQALVAHLLDAPATICGSAVLTASATVDGASTVVAATLVNAIWFPFPWSDLFNLDCEIESGAPCTPAFCTYQVRDCDQPIYSICTPTVSSQCMCSRNHDAEDECRRRHAAEDALK